MVTWAALQQTPHNLFKVHPFVDELMVRTATGEDSSQPSVPSVAVKKSR
jgi:hypothetical protein